MRGGEQVRRDGGRGYPRSNLGGSNQRRHVSGAYFGHKIRTRSVSACRFRCRRTRRVRPEVTQDVLNVGILVGLATAGGGGGGGWVGGGGENR